MSQHGFTTFAASQRNDGDLPAILEALQSGHIGTVRPAYVVDGMTWHLHRPNEGAAGTIERWFTYGGQDFFEGAFDLDDGTYSGAGGGGDRVAIVSQDMTGLTVFEFTAFDPARFAGYLIASQGLRSSDGNGDGATLSLSVDGGATYNAATYEWVGTLSDSGDDASNLVVEASSESLTSRANMYAADPGGAAAGEIRLHHQVGGEQLLYEVTSRRKWSGSAPRLLREDIVGVFETTNLVDGARVVFGSALSGGSITVFGYRKGTDLA